MSLSNKFFSNTRHNSIPEGRDIFGRFIGGWHLNLVIYKFDGSNKKHQGEWHFFRILQGRAIQDIWIIPDLNSSGKHDFYEYGTTVRKFNPKTENWSAVWVGPVQDQLFEFDIEDSEETIVLTEKGNLKLEMKWTFFDITANSFQWKSEVKVKGSGSWFTNFHMSLSRIKS